MFDLARAQSRAWRHRSRQLPPQQEVDRQGHLASRGQVFAKVQQWMWKAMRPLYFILTFDGKGSYGKGKMTPLCSKVCHLMEPSPSASCSHHLYTSASS